MRVKTIRNILTIAAFTGLVASCVYVDQTLGSNMIPANQQYEIHMTEFKLSNVKMGFADSLSAYSDSRITVGAIRDDRFGLTTRSSAVTLIPLVDEVDVGIDPSLLYFHFTAVRDTTSVSRFDQQKILQSVNVYELNTTLDSTFVYTWDDRYETFYDASERITIGVPVYAGGDSLSFDFTEAYAQKVIDVFLEDPAIAEDIEEFTKKVPGIYITVDPPIGDGGRINMFDCPIEVDDYGYVTGCYAELYIKTKYEESEEYRDTSFLFYFGPEEKTTTTDQYAFNICTHESNTLFQMDDDGLISCGEDIYVEGGGGLKPVFNAIEFKTLMMDELEAQGLGAEDVIINKATITMNYVEPTDYDYYYLMPSVLSPTSKFSYDSDLVKADGTTMRYVYYAGLTDSSVADENQGDINRSLVKYSPDITHHLQEILKVSEDTLATGRYDVWMLVLAAELVTTDTSNEDMAEYYEYLAYESYYNSMYGYGGYSNYDSYSNYYYYMYLADAYANSSYTSTENVLDKDRYYTAVLKGPTSDDGPTLKVVYSTLKQDDE
ncbi:MAG: hypothetical protein LUD72_09855 [Bacteroidales bacterium]|nr:hypothetical protein [Bacteroidales bacterium]